MAITQAQRKLALQAAVIEPGIAQAALGVTHDQVLTAILNALGVQFDPQMTTICNYLAAQAAGQNNTYTVV